MMSCYYKRYSLFISVIRMQNPVSQIVSILLSLSLTQLIFISINVIFSISQNIRDKAEDIFVSQIGTTWVSATNPDLLEKFAPPSSPSLPLQFLHHLLKFTESKVVDSTASNSNNNNNSKNLFYAQRFVRSSVLLLPHLLDAPFQRLTPDENVLLTDLVSLIASSTKDVEFSGLLLDRKIFFANEVVNVLKSAIAGNKFTSNNHQVVNCSPEI